jgi:predicted ABC-class ATPase
MRDEDRLRSELKRLDGRGYKAFKDLTGLWAFKRFELRIDHVQGDPFATPTRVSVTLSPERTGLPSSAYANEARALGTAAHLARRFSAEARRATSRTRGATGHSGEICMQDPGQVVLLQSAAQLTTEGILEARFTIGLPARGRRIDGSGAIELLLKRVPTLVASTLLAGAHDLTEVERSAATNEDAEALRSALAARTLVAFVADGSVLPRRSGVDDRPLDAPAVTPCISPETLRVRIETPNQGTVLGMGIPEGVTLVVGGGFHGKSTLLRALQAGVWNHAPHDGREFVVTRMDAVKVRAEDGRSIAGVDISPFIDGLPGGTSTTAFSTPNASGSTSQAAAIIEAMETGSRLLLVDEDTSATNFMIRDRRMQQLVPPEGEPITPFVDRIEELRDDHGVSTVLVLGGSGDYLDVADLVIRMDAYLPLDVTPQARATAERLPTGREMEASAALSLPGPRRIEWGSVDPARGRRRVHVKTPDDRTLLFGKSTIDLMALEQLTGRAQIRAIGLALAWAAELRTDNHIPDILDATMDALSQGLDTFDEFRTGDTAGFRRQELAAVLNRLRSLRVV